MVAPLAYQKGPLTPYCQATFELCKIVAAHVHCTQQQQHTTHNTQKLVTCAQPSINLTENKTKNLGLPSPNLAGTTTLAGDHHPHLTSRLHSLGYSSDTKARFWKLNVDFFRTHLGNNHTGYETGLDVAPGGIEPLGIMAG